jgi:hypothetical protein
MSARRWLTYQHRHLAAPPDRTIGISEHPDRKTAFGGVCVMTDDEIVVPAVVMTASRSTSAAMMTNDEIAVAAAH